MSKPTAKKVARSKKKRGIKKRKQDQQKVVSRNPSPIAPSFNAEQLNAPASLFGWIGKKIASFLKFRL